MNPRRRQARRESAKARGWSSIDLLGLCFVALVAGALVKLVAALLGRHWPWSTVLPVAIGVVAAILFLGTLTGLIRCVIQR